VPQIEIENLHFTHAFSESSILRGVNLSVEKGEIIALIGESGCGKTTLLTALMGLAPDFMKGELKGNIRVCGSNNPIDFRKSIEPVFQNPEIQLFSLRVREELFFQLRKNGTPKSEREQRADNILEEFGLSLLAERKIETLSWGEKQKLALACAVAPMPDILLLDEPLSGLDPVHKSILLDRLKEINRKYGTTIIIIEHEVPLMREFADRIYLFRDGTLVDGAEACMNAEAESYHECCFNPGAEPVVEAESVSHSYSLEVRALDCVDANLRRKECVAVIGPNGAGKTTLGKCLSGMLVPSCGRIRYFGQDARRARRNPIARWTGFMFQNPDRQLFAQTVRAECLYASGNFGVSDDEAAASLAEIAEALNITRLLDRAPVTLSYGEKKRVALASVLVHKPNVLVLDEPVAGLDQWNAGRILRLLKETHHAGAGIVFITHDMSLVRNLATRVIFLKNGRKIYDGPTAGFFKSDWRQLYIEKSC